MKRLFIQLTLVLAVSVQLHAQTFTDSNLPIVIITLDKPNDGIPDESKVLASMKIIYKGEGLRNSLSDQNTPSSLNYSGRIGIETRGSTSQLFGKKPYSVTTLLADNISNNNVSLLGMPKDNDWVLNALVYDSSSIRDYISYNLSRRIGTYAPRTQYCEVAIDGQYAGLYMLMEKIKVGDNRVNITKLSSTDNTLPDLTGGYITKADKVAGQDVPSWTMSSYIDNNDINFINEYPKASVITNTQSQYIQSKFEKLSLTASNPSVDSGYPSVIDIPSFVDFIIINELSANVDAYKYSTFFHKDRNGKLRAGPVWDLNLSYANDLKFWGLDRSMTDQWQFSNGDNTGPKFWTDLFNNSQFKCYLSKRWNELTQSGKPLNLVSLKTYIDQTVATISEASARNNAWWGIDDSGEIDVIKKFLEDRITWMTKNIGPFAACSNVATPPLVISKISYHPATSSEFTDSNDQEFIEIVNNGNDPVNLTGYYFSGTGFVYSFPNSILQANGVLQIANKLETFKKLFGFSPYGEFTRNLSNSSQQLTLADAFGNIIDQVEYSTEAPWPDADGNGSYIKLKDLNLDNAIGANWEASTESPETNIVTGIEDPETVHVELSPNPVETVLVIKTGNKIKSLQFHDIQGRLLETISASSNSVTVNMSHFRNGLYLLTITTDKNTVIRKVLKK